MPTRMLALLAALSLSLVACGDDGSELSGGGAATCEYAEGGPAARAVEAPPEEPAYSGEVAVTIATSAGGLAATLDADAAPCTVGSLLSLAEQGYFDDTECHRLTEGRTLKVLQCGDPTGSGSGGPGYTFDDELAGDETYGAGTLAMANSGPATNGSQFFVVYDDSDLPPKYTVFGQVDDDAVATVEQVAADGSDNAYGPGDGRPNTAVTITGVTVD